MHSIFLLCISIYHVWPPTLPRLFVKAAGRGAILKTSIGKNGFGYDPVFYIPEEKCTAAELPLERKNQLSHRGKALKILIEKMRDSCQLNCQNLTKVYANGLTALKGINLTVEEGDFFALLGKNGAGKSILLAFYVP